MHTTILITQGQHAVLSHLLLPLPPLGVHCRVHHKVRKSVLRMQGSLPFSLLLALNFFRKLQPIHAPGIVSVQDLDPRHFSRHIPFLPRADTAVVDALKKKCF